MDPLIVKLGYLRESSKYELIREKSRRFSLNDHSVTIGAESAECC